MSWFFLTVISLFSRAIYGVMSKVLSTKLDVSPYTQATLLTFVAGCLAVIASPFLGGFDFVTENIEWKVVLLVMLSQGLGNILYFAALKILTNGTAQITFSSILIFNTLLGTAFLDLQLSLLNAVGFILLLIAILSVVTGKLEFNKRGVVLMVIAAFLFSIFQLSSAALSKAASPATYLIIAYLGSAFVVFALKSKTIIRDLASSRKRRLLYVTLLAALPSIGNFLFAYYAYKSAPEPAKVAMLLTAQVVVAVILSYFILKEKSHVLRKIIAALLVVISAILIKQ